MSVPSDKGAPRFPGFDVLSQRHGWDATTRAVVFDRLDPKPRSFFTEREEVVCRALCNVLMALDGSAADPPVFEMVDARLAEGVTDGWHYDNMPPDSRAWRQSIAELDRQVVCNVDPGRSSAA